MFLAGFHALLRAHRCCLSAFSLVNLMMREQTLIPKVHNPFLFYRIDTVDANVHKAIACKYPSNSICTVVEEWHHGSFCLGYFFS